MDKSTIVKMYYDDYEKDYGDGFYPLLEKTDACSTEITIRFALDAPNKKWKQMNSYNINGLDGNAGDLLLTKLNTINNVMCIGIVNKMNKNLHIQ